MADCFRANEMLFINAAAAAEKNETFYEEKIWRYWRQPKLARHDLAAKIVENILYHILGRFYLSIFIIYSTRSLSRFAALLLVPAGGITAPVYSHFRPKWSPLCQWSPQITPSMSMSPKMNHLCVNGHSKWAPSMSIVTQNDPPMCPWSPKKTPHMCP